MSQQAAERQNEGQPARCAQLQQRLGQGAQWVVVLRAENLEAGPPAAHNFNGAWDMVGRFQSDKILCGADCLMTAQGSGWCRWILGMWRSHCGLLCTGGLLAHC